jgi:hypothetical protein
MPGAAPLKVYRTAIGFHDAYVAVPSQKAALKAWGSDKDLFARGAAELVTEPELIAQPLASPGKVIKLLRGTEEEQIAALPPDKPRSSEAPKQASPPPSSSLPPKPPKLPKRRPSRSPLVAAERKVAEVKAAHAEQIKALAAREAALARERRMLKKAQAAELDQAQRAHEREAAAHEEALARWKA